jgi:hypothetical protein
MVKQHLVISSGSLNYGLRCDSFENDFEQEGLSSELPSVSYLALRYEDEIYLPISIFKSSMAPLQALVKYLKETRGLRNRSIASLLDRDVRTVWSTYAAVKSKKTSPVQETGDVIPLSIFKSSKLSILESLVSYLRQKGLSYADIARLIGKDQRTVWTVNARFKRKIVK